MSSQTPLKRVPYSRTLVLTMVGVFSLVSILTGSSLLSPQKANAALATNNTLNFQARLETNTGAIVPDGYYNVQFKLYDGDTSGGPAGQGVGFAGTNLWTETWYDSNGVSPGNDNRIQVKNGYLTASLGSQNPFPSTINWDQNLWITLNIGGVTQTATPTWDGEMNPRLALTGVPYAFKAAQLAQFNATTGFTATLSILQPTVGNQIFQIPDMGAAGTYTLCVQGGSCGGGGGGGVTLQATTPGTTDTGNFHVSGTGIAAILQAGTFDTASATTLNLGTSNATNITVGSASSTGTITIGQSTASNTINIGNATIAASNTGAINIGTASTGTGKTVITIGSTNGASSLLLQSGTGNLQLQTQGGTLGVGNNAVAQSLIIGNTTAGTTLSLQGGSSATAVALSAASGGTLSFGSSGVANTINIGNTGAAGSVAQTVNIATNSTAGGTNTINIGNSAATASAIALQGGTGASAVAISAASGGTLAFGSSGVANTINIGNTGAVGTVAQTIRLGTNSTAGATNTIIIGNAAATASTVAIAGGTSAAAVALTTGVGGTLSLGDNGAASTVQVGNTTGGVAQTVNVGTNSTASANNTVNVGSLIDGSTTTIQGGTGGINLLTNNATLGVSVKTSTNLSSAFMIQNSDAQPIFQADTTHAVNLTNNGGFDSPLGGGIGGWAATGTGASVTRTTTASQTYSGIGALAVTLGSVSGTGAQLQSTGLAGGSLATGTYTISFYARGSAAISGLAVSFSGGGTCTLNSTSVSTAGFQRYVCTVTTTGATTSINITATTTAQTLYIDSVQVQSGSSATPYTSGTLHITGVVGSPFILQNTADSTAAFQIQNAAGTSTLFNADTMNGQITVGGNLQVTTSSGSTPALAVDTSVGTTTLRGVTTASDAAVLSSELVTSQAFNNASFWTCSGWTTTSTTAAHNTGNTTACSATASNFTVTAGTTYQVAYQLAGNTTASNTAAVSIGGASASAIGQTGTNIQTAIIKATTTGALTFTPTTNFNGTISNVSVKPITFENSVLNVQSSGGVTNLEVRTGGTSNTFIGLSAGIANTTGSNNTATGTSALQNNTSGFFNAAFGVQALQNNTTGSSNTASGYQSLQLNTTGHDNAAFGKGSLQNNTTAFGNAAFGSNALQVNTTGNGNTAVGSSSLVNSTTGASNVAVGGSSLLSNTTGSFNTVLGSSAGNQDGDSFVTGAALQNATAIGANTQVQASNSLILGSVGTSGNTSVGIGTTIPLNTFSVSPIDISGTASATTGGVVTATIGTFTSAMVGEQLIFANGVSGTISSFTSGTVVNITPSPSSTVSSQSFRVHKIGFQVSSGGNAAVGVNAFNGKLTVGGEIALQESSAPSATSGYGKIYASSSDHALHFVNASGTDTALGAGGASTLQGAYTGSGATSPQIVLNNSFGGIVIADASTAVTGNLFAVKNNAASATYLGISASALTLQNSSGYNAMIFDSTTNHLKIYEAVASPSRYADIYYDNTAGEAVFTASSGTTRVGSGSGNVTIALTNQGDVFQYTKTNTLSSAYSLDDALIQRNITAGANSLTGSVLRVESTSTGSGTVSSNILWLNENNASATGNLILATKGGSGNPKFTVDDSGNVTVGTSATFSGGTFSGTTFTGPSGVTVTAGSGTALTLTSPTAATWSTTSGNLTLQAGGANKVILKPGTDSTDALEIQNAGGSPLLVADSNSGNLKVGGGDVSANATPVLLVVDHKTTAGDPTGVNGAMYYNESINRFRCYENSIWVDCTPGTVKKTADQTISAASQNNLTDLVYPVAANVDYAFTCSLVYNSAAVGTGIRLGVTVPASPTYISYFANIGGASANNLGAEYDGVGSSSGALIQSGSVAAINTDYIANLTGVLNNGATAGNIQIRGGSGTAGTNVVFRAGSYCKFSEM